MVQIGDTWYWSPNDNLEDYELGEFGKISIDGKYGTPDDRPGQSGVASVTGSFKIDDLNFTGVADLNRLGKIEKGKLTDINFKLTEKDLFNIAIGVDTNGAYVRGELFGHDVQIGATGLSVDGIIAQLEVQVPVDLEWLRDSLDLLPLLEEVFDSDKEIHNAFQAIYNHAAETRDAWPDDYHNQCFGVGTSIDMWPLDLSLKPGPDEIYDQNEVRAKTWKKPIEEIKVGDTVVSFDDGGNMVPGYVPRTFQKDAKILLNFHGTRVTPGHVYYRADSKKSHKFETLIDILRDDGVIQHQDGTLIRAATNVPVDSPRDGFVKAVIGTRKPDGTIITRCEGRIRLGTRFIADNRSLAVADLIKAGGGVVGEDEMIRVNGGTPMPFFWDFGDTLPKPEDFVLACSNTTLEDIYKAAEWESQGPRLPAPMVMDGGPIRPLSTTALNVMPRNEPLDLDHKQKPAKT